MLYCIYLTIYQGTKLPMFYVGSTSVQKIQNGYRGSVSSEDYKTIWLTELKNNPQLFTTKILSTYPTRDEAYDIEHKIHQLLKTYKNPLYINRSTGCPRNNGIAWNKGLTAATDARIANTTGINPKKSLPGKLNGMWGKTHTDEVKAGLALIPVLHLKGKTYEEIHGNDRADELKQQRSESLTDYLKQNPTVRQGKNNGNAKSYKFVDPVGAEHIVNGEFKTFCRANKLEFGAVINCAKGRRASYKGWSISYA
jgi:hypothetical protein